MTQVGVRYLVDDVEEAMSFYTDLLGFDVERHPGPGFVSLTRGPLRLLLSSTSGPGGAAQPAADGAGPQPGGWNRIQLVVDDLAGEVDSLRAAGATLRNDIVSGMGGSQVVLEDPSGNPVELFQPVSR